MIVFDRKLDAESVKSHIIHLHQLARIDDIFVKEEKRFLYELGRKNGIDEATVDSYLKDVEDHPFILPESKKDKIVLLYEYIRMMLVDNKLDEREAKMCMIIAQKMGFDKGLVNGITKAIVTAEADNATPTLTKDQLTKYIDNPESL